MRLKDKVVIVTGSSRGIGKGIALECAKEGAKVVVAARSEEERERYPGTIYSTVEEIKALGGMAIPVRVDVSEEEQVQNLIKRTMEEFGRIDAVINNAGTIAMGTVAELPSKRWDVVMRVNLRGPFLCSKYAIPIMMQQKSGAIVSVFSTGGQVASPGNVSYSVSKAGLIMFTAGLSEEVKEYNIAVNGLAPTRLVVTEGSRFWDFPETDTEPREYMGRAAVILATKDASYTGKNLLSQDVLKEHGLL